MSEIEKVVGEAIYVFMQAGDLEGNWRCEKESTRQLYYKTARAAIAVYEVHKSQALAPEGQHQNTPLG